MNSRFSVWQICVMYEGKVYGVCFVWDFAGGKSAILTALCVAFGCRAKGTQRASSLKDFIKTGAR